MRKRLTILSISVLFIVVLSVAACTKSKLPPAPTLVTTGETTVTAGPTATAGEVQTVTATVISVETPTPIPTLTATPEEGEEGTTPTPTTEAEPTPTTAPKATAAPPTGTEFEYVVKAGDSLWGLALRFGTTVEQIKSRNGLTSDIIYKGQKLILAGTDQGQTVTHIVQPGENLFRISLKYGTTVEAIAALNNIINPSFVYAGQKLTVPKGTTAPGGGVRYHVVQPGETLSSIALRYGTTPWKIAAANGIGNINLIYAGRTLRIP
jgi:LysM repeat protein